MFIQQLANGLSVGSVYALMAVGYALIYSLLNFTNFAHSITVTIGAFAIVLLSYVCYGKPFLGGLRRELWRRPCWRHLLSLLLTARC